MTNPAQNSQPSGALSHEPSGVPQYARIPHWMKISGVGRTATYVALAAGELKAVKLGRATLIDVRHGLTWLASLPPAEFRAPKAKAQ